MRFSFLSKKRFASCAENIKRLQNAILLDLDNQDKLGIKMHRLTSNPENVEVELLWGWQLLINRMFLRSISKIVKHHS